MNINLISKTESVVKTIAFDLEIDGKKIVYVEFLNEKEKVIDFTLRDGNGYELTDDSAPGNNVAALLEVIQEMIDDAQATKNK